MGDVIWLGDRDPACASRYSGRKASARLGFSTASPGRPCRLRTQFGYQAVNVEAQRDTSTSLLNFTRTMLAVRRRHPAFAVGAFK